MPGVQRERAAEDGAGDGGGEQASNGDGELLKHFWDLSSLHHDERQSSADALVDGIARALDAAADENGAPSPAASAAEWPPVVDYSMKRLLKGLGSSNKGARQGFATALAGMLQAMGTRGALTVERALEIINEALPTAGGNAKRVDVREASLGRLFALAALSRSGLPQSAGDAEGILEGLMAVASSSPFLREAACTAVIDMLQRLPAKEATRAIAKCGPLKEMLTADEESATPDALTLALSLWPLLPEDVLSACTLLPALGPEDRPPLQFITHVGECPHPSEASRAFFDRSHLPRVAGALRAASAVAPRVHSCWLAAVALLAPGFRPQPWSGGRHRRDGERPRAGDHREGDVVPDARTVSPMDAASLSALWEMVVEQRLLSTASDDRHSLAFHLCQLLLSRCPAASAPVLLSRRLLTVLATHLAQRDSYLHGAAQALLSRIKSVASGAADKELRIAILVALQTHGAHGFDAAAKTTVASELLSSVTAEDVGHYLVRLEELFVSEGLAAARVEAEGAVTTAEDEAEGDEAETGGAAGQHRKRLMWAADHLVSALRMDGVTAESRDHVARLLATHAFLAADPANPKALGAAVKADPVLKALKKLDCHRSVREHCAGRVLQLVAEAGQPAPQGQGNKGRKGANAGEGEANGKGGQKDGKGAPGDWRAAREAQVAAQRECMAQVLGFCDRALAGGGVVLAASVAADDPEVAAGIASCVGALRDAGAALRRMPGDPRCVALALVADTARVFAMGAPHLIDLRVGEDVSGIAARLAGKGSGSGGGEGPHWSEVLVDLSLDLLSRDVAPLPGVALRGAVEAAVGACAGDLTSSALGSLVGVLGQPVGAEEDGSDGESGEGESGSEDGSEGSDEGSDASMSGDEESEGGAEGDGGLGEALDRLREQRGAGSDEEASLPDVDDEEMFKMDKAIAAMVKDAQDRRKDAVQARRSSLALKFRAAALLDLFLAKQPASPMVPGMVVPCLEALRAAAMPSGDAQLAKRIQALIVERLSRAKVQSGAGLDLAQGQAMLRACLVAASRAPSRQVADITVPAAERLVSYTLRILTRVHSSDPNAKPDVREDGVALATEALRQSVQDFFSSKRTAMRKSLLLNVIREWAPETGALLLPTLIKFASEGRNEVKRAEALGMVAEVLSRNPKQYGEAAAREVKPCLPALAKALAAVAKGGFKSPRVHGDALQAAADVAARIASVCARHGAALGVAEKAAILEACREGEAQTNVSSRTKTILARLTAVLEGGAAMGAGGAKGAGAGGAKASGQGQGPTGGQGGPGKGGKNAQGKGGAKREAEGAEKGAAGAGKDGTAKRKEGKQGVGDKGGAVKGSGARDAGAGAKGQEGKKGKREREGAEKDSGKKKAKK